MLNAKEENNMNFQLDQENKEVIEETMSNTKD
jgi:hypothetical protein